MLLKMVPMVDLLTELRRRDLGIDLLRRGKEVRKLLMSGFGGTIQKSGWDVEDVLQDVYVGILTRNNGTCPWDAKKSSFGHYVYMICRCVVANYARKQARIRREQVGLMDSEGIEVDAGELAVDVADASSYVDSVDYLTKNLDGIDQGVLIGLLEGQGRGSIRKESGLDALDYDSSIEEVRKVVRDMVSS